jgi:hypothetical protein
MLDARCGLRRPVSRARRQRPLPQDAAEWSRRPRALARSAHPAPECASQTSLPNGLTRRILSSAASTAYADFADAEPRAPTSDRRRQHTGRCSSAWPCPALQLIEIQASLHPDNRFLVQHAPGRYRVRCRFGELGERVGQVLLLPGPQPGSVVVSDDRHPEPSHLGSYSHSPDAPVAAGGVAADPASATPGGCGDDPGSGIESAGVFGPGLVAPAGVAVAELPVLILDPHLAQSRVRGESEESGKRKRADNRPFSQSLSQHSVRPKRLELPTF